MSPGSQASPGSCQGYGEVIAFPGRDKSAEQAAEPEPLWREAAGRELRRERQRTERTLADVAGDAGVSIQYLSEVERGLKEPSSEVLGAVSRALGLSLGDLTIRVARTLHTTRRTPSSPQLLAA